ncbi:MAG: sigma 54-interacting transcriptional regulator [bacterium]
MSSILLLQGGVPKIKIPLGDSCVLGRSSECDLQLLDHQLSRTHARIERRGDVYWLEDLGSRNGTFLADCRITQPVRLQVGDEIRLGGASLIFEPPLEVQHERGGDKTLYVIDDEALAPPAGGAGKVERVEAVGDAVGASAVAELDPEALLAIHELTCEVMGLLDLELLLGKLLDRLMAFFEADRGFVLLRGEVSGRLRPAVIRTEREAVAISRSLIDHAVKERVPVLVSDAIDDVSFEGSRSVIAHQLRSVMLVPMLAEDEVIGLIQLDRNQRGAYDQASLSRFALLARAAALAVKNAREYARQRLRSPSEQPGAGADPDAEGTPFVGEDARITQLLETTRKAARAGSRLLITGESGVGKELIARRIHEQSARAQGPWVAINCAAVPETLLESELFGHEKGAFTGAVRRKRGCFELADEGTLFLDEIGELPLAMQVKLLRAIQESSFFRVGGEKPVEVDVRIVAATNRRLADQVQQGRFREDLFYRLAVLTLEVPPLRERRGDVAALMRFFLQRFGRQLGRPVPRIDPAALEKLEQYHWPGNVRELGNVAERLMVLCESGVIDVAELPTEVALASGPGAPSRPLGKLREVLAETERELIAQALAEAGGKKVEACRLLGISRPTLDKKIADYGIEL